MILLNAENITKSYNERPLLQSISLAIDQGDKIGVIGVNGTGKSTLLKIIAGAQEAEQGQVTLGRGVRINYLSQNPVFQQEATILQQVLSGVSSLEREAKSYKAKSILTKLGFTDLEQQVGPLSGGQKKRVALACALVSESEILILDEPTNHIDSSMVNWLENYLARYKGALLMVTHDRYFLDRVANRIVEIDQGSLYTYPANYSKFLELKAQREEMEAATQRKRQSLLRRELEWIQRGARARGTKARFRVERFEELSSQGALEPQAKLEINAAASRLGKKTIELKNISKSYPGKQLIADFSYNLLRGDRLGIVGPNGCGKSTLLKIICGLVQPDAGTVSIGETVKIGYFSQECEDMDHSLRAIDYIRNFALEVETPRGTLTAAQLMETFLFDSLLQYTPIERLSGGERRRLYLLGILMQAPNVLLLDEPTNDLDIQTLTILEDYLSSFSGAVVAVSHDRYFLDKVVNHIFAYEENGTLKQYLGGYSDYFALYREEQQHPPKKQGQSAGSSDKPYKPVHEKKLKFTYKEQKEFDEIDAVIAGLEESIAAVQEEINLQSANFTRLQELLEEKESLEGALAEKMDRWVYLNDLNDQIQQQNSKA